MAGCAFIQVSSGELSIPTVQPGCAENVLSSKFEYRQVARKANIEAVIRRKSRNML